MNWNDSKLAGAVSVGDLIRMPVNTVCIYQMQPGAEVAATQQRLGVAARRAGGNVSVSVIRGFEGDEPVRLIRVTVTEQAPPRQPRGRKASNLA